jgi:membrane-associated protein
MRDMIASLSSSLTKFSALLGFIDPEVIIATLGLAGILAVVFAESGLLIGFFLPGDSLLFTAGFLTNVEILKINIHLLIVLLFIAAVLGDSVGYAFGRRIGRRLFNRPNSRLFKQENIQRAEAFYEKYGGKTIILARFIPVVRTFAPVVAGVGKMKYTTFLSYNLIGGALWTGGITYAGFLLGGWFTNMGLNIDQVILPIVIIIILLSISPAIIHLAKDKQQRSALWEGTKREITSLFKRK